MAPLRIVTWNCKGAPAQSAAWDYLLELNPSVALLQEVGELPDRVRSIYECDHRPAVRPGGEPQRFSTALLVRGRFGEAFSLKGLAAWADAELDRFAGNLICREVIPDEGPAIKALCVYNPAWQIPPERLVGVDLTGVRLSQNPGLWLSDILWASLKRIGLSPEQPWVIGGDFNLSETFDQASWSAGGNREYLERMGALGLVECLRHKKGAVTPTFRNASGGEVKHQIDHLFVTAALARRLGNCDTGPSELVFGSSLSDHLPIVADFASGT